MRETISFKKNHPLTKTVLKNRWKKKHHLPRDENWNEFEFNSRKYNRIVCPMNKNMNSVFHSSSVEQCCLRRDASAFVCTSASQKKPYYHCAIAYNLRLLFSMVMVGIVPGASCCILVVLVFVMSSRKWLFAHAQIMQYCNIYSSFGSSHKTLNFSELSAHAQVIICYLKYSTKCFLCALDAYRTKFDVQIG